MSEISLTYAWAENIVLRKYWFKPDSKGNSQKWKIDWINKDRLDKKITGISQVFAEEVSSTAEGILIVKSFVQNLCNFACKEENVNELNHCENFEI